MESEEAHEAYLYGFWTAAIVVSLFWLFMFGGFMYYVGAYYPG